MDRIFFLYGDNLNLIKDRIDEISLDISSSSQSKPTLEKLELSNDLEIETFISSGFNVPLFAEASLLQVNLGSTILKINENTIEKFLNVIKAISLYKIVTLVFYLEKFDKNIKKLLSGSPIFIGLDEECSKESFFKLKQWQFDEIKNTVTRLADKYSIHFENEALKLFVHCNSEELDNIEQELKKIQTYIVPGNVVNEDVVRDLYITSYSVDDLYDFLLLKNNHKHLHVVSLINKLKTLKSPLYFIASLQNKIREALQIKVYAESKLNNSQISKLTGVHPYRIEKEISFIRNIPLEHLKTLLFKLSDLEYKIKTGVISDKHALDMLVINMP